MGVQMGSTPYLFIAFKNQSRNKDLPSFAPPGEAANISIPKYQRFQWVDDARSDRRIGRFRAIVLCQTKHVAPWHWGGICCWD